MFSLKQFVDFLLNQTEILTEEYFNNLVDTNQPYDKNKVTIIMYNNQYKTITKIPYIDSIACNIVDSVTVVTFKDCIFRTISKLDDLEKFKIIDKDRKNEKSFIFSSDGKLLYSIPEDFPEINIKEMDEEMDLYLTMKYLNN